MAVSNPRRIDPATLAGTAIVVAAGIAALGPHVLAGGFHADDWVDASNYYLHPGHGFWAAVSNAHNINRDAWALLRTTNFALFGMHSARHLALTALVAIAESCALLLLARRLGLAAAPATVMALLLLALPDADSTRLWANGVQQELFAGLLPLAGLLVALPGLERPGWRGAALHGVALALYAIGVSGYELCAPLIALLGVLYVRRASWATARWRWAADVLVVLAVLVRYSQRRGTPPLSDVPHHLQIIATDGLGVIARALIPVRGVPAVVVLAPALAIVAAAAVAAHAPRVGTDTRVQLRRMLLVLGCGLAVTVVGWAMIVPADLGYDPGSAGVGNRINAVAAIGLAVAVVAFVGIVAVAMRARSGIVSGVRARSGIVSGVRARSHRSGLSLALLTSLLAVPIVVADFARLEHDAHNWNQAASAARGLLVRLRALVPSPAPGSTLFTFGVSGYSAPSVPIFGGGGNNDLLGAVRITYGTRAISGFPVLGGMQFSCEPATMTLLDTGAPSTTRYGLAVLVDLRGPGRVLTPRDQSDCARETAQLAPYAPVNESG